MAERLDRFTWSNHLHQSAHLIKNKHLSTLAEEFSGLPARWWLNPNRPTTHQAFTILENLIQLMIQTYQSTHPRDEVKPQSSRSHHRAGHSSVVLVVHRAIQHLTHYGGSEWKRFVGDAYTRGGVTIDGLIEAQEAHVIFWNDQLRSTQLVKAKKSNQAWWEALSLGAWCVFFLKKHNSFKSWWWYISIKFNLTLFSF